MSGNGRPLGLLAVLLLVLAGCSGSGSIARIPPCNAWILLWGAADLHLVCPAAATGIPVFEKLPAKQEAP